MMMMHDEINYDDDDDNDNDKLIMKMMMMISYILMFSMLLLVGSTSSKVPASQAKRPKPMINKHKICIQKSQRTVDMKFTMWAP